MEVLDVNFIHFHFSGGYFSSKGRFPCGYMLIVKYYSINSEKLKSNESNQVLKMLILSVSISTF